MFSILVIILKKDMLLIYDFCYILYIYYIFLLNISKD